MPPLAATAPPQTTPKPASQTPAVPRAGTIGRFAALLAPPAPIAAAAPVSNVAPVKGPVAPGPALAPTPGPPAVVPAPAGEISVAPGVVTDAKPATSEPVGKIAKIGKPDAASKTSAIPIGTAPVASLAPTVPSGQPVPLPPPVAGLPAQAEAEPAGTAPVATSAATAAPAKPSPPAELSSSAQAAPAIVETRQPATAPSKPAVASVTAPFPVAPSGVPAPQFAAPVGAAPSIHTHTASPPDAGKNHVAPQIEQPVRLALSLERTGTGQTVSVSLHPAELGRIDVRVARDPAGLVQVTLTADRPETAARLAADQPALHAALDRAGVAAERVVTVQAAASPDAAAFPAQTGAFSQQAGGGGQGDRAPRPAMPPGASGLPPPSPGEPQPTGATTRRLGLDITA